jgi:hypothetical protein
MSGSGLMKFSSRLPVLLVFDQSTAPALTVPHPVKDGHVEERKTPPGEPM